MKNIILIIVASIITTGCGGSKDPLEKYPNVKSDIPPVNLKTEDQAYKAGCGINIVAPPTLFAIEEKMTSVEIYVRGPHASSTQSLSINETPVGFEQPVKGGMTPNGLMFVIKYAPPRGTVEVGKSFKSFQIELAPISQSVATEQCPTQMGIVVSSTSEVPMIKEISAPDKINPTTASHPPIRLDVVATGLKDNQALDLNWDFDSNAVSKENPVINLAPDIKGTHPLPLGNNTYRYLLDIDPDILQTIIVQFLKVNSEFLKRNPTRTSIDGLVRFSVSNQEQQPPLISPHENLVIKIVRPAPEAPPPSSAAVLSDNSSTAAPGTTAGPGNLVQAPKPDKTPVKATGKQRPKTTGSKVRGKK
ncbi:MAG: hypothetical protein IPK68_02700 [Bdellovibrionales bacterium]|nr:hypothetical protein [Bdellovibrionales bacterium]